MTTPDASDILRGTTRLLQAHGAAALAEFKLVTGRRLDVLALERDGSFTVVEIKSCRRDFLSDGKWQEYLAFADRFYFAVGPGFPLDLLPAEVGIIVADRFEGHVERPAATCALPAARRRALLLRFARTAAARVMGADELALTDATL